MINRAFFLVVGIGVFFFACIITVVWFDSEAFGILFVIFLACCWGLYDEGTDKKTEDHESEL